MKSKLITLQQVYRWEISCESRERLCIVGAIFLQSTQFHDHRYNVCDWKLQAGCLNHVNGTKRTKWLSCVLALIFVQSNRDQLRAAHKTATSARSCLAFTDRQMMDCKSMFCICQHWPSVIPDNVSRAQAIYESMTWIRRWLLNLDVTESHGSCLKIFLQCCEVRFHSLRRLCCRVCCQLQFHINSRRTCDVVCMWMNCSSPRFYCFKITSFQCEV